jgi:hypothetical protein
VGFLAANDFQGWGVKNPQIFELQTLRAACLSLLYKRGVRLSFIKTPSFAARV